MSENKSKKTTIEDAKQVILNAIVIAPLDAALPLAQAYKTLVEAQAIDEDRPRFDGERRVVQ